MRQRMLLFHVTLPVQCNADFQRMNAAFENRLRFQFPTFHQQQRNVWRNSLSGTPQSNKAPNAISPAIPAKQSK
jgi:hypothetical protein